MQCRPLPENLSYLGNNQLVWLRLPSELLVLHVSQTLDDDVNVIGLKYINNSATIKAGKKKHKHNDSRIQCTVV